MAAIDIHDFDRLTIPFRAVAADIETGQAVVLAKGDLATAMRASMAVPGVFAPVPWQGRLLVDGGIARNLPVDVARELGCASGDCGGCRDAPCRAGSNCALYSISPCRSRAYLPIRIQRNRSPPWDRGMCISIPI